MDFSSDSDDVPLAARVAARTAMQPSQASQPSQAASEDPDWVVSYTPVRREAAKDSDSDSLLNLISDDDPAPSSQPASQTPSQTPSQLASQPGEGDTVPKKRKAGRKAAAPKAELKLVMAGRLDDGLTLLQFDGDGDVDLSGDVGAVGRVKIENNVALLDIKGTLYRARRYPCSTACVVAVADDEARISALMNEAVALRTERNVFAAHDGAQDGHMFKDDDVDGPILKDADGAGSSTGGIQGSDDGVGGTGEGSQGRKKSSVGAGGRESRGRVRK